MTHKIFGCKFHHKFIRTGCITIKLQEDCVGGDGETERRRKGAKGVISECTKKKKNQTTLQNIFLINYEKKPGQKEAQQQQAAIELQKIYLPRHISPSRPPSGLSSVLTDVTLISDSKTPFLCNTFVNHAAPSEFTSFGLRG